MVSRTVTVALTDRQSRTKLSVPASNIGLLLTASARVNKVHNEDLQRALLRLRDAKLVPSGSCLIVSNFHQAGKMWKFAFANL
jgi:hypothetical protein